MPADDAAAVLVAQSASASAARGVGFSLLGCHVSVARGAYSHHGIVSAVSVDARGMQRPDRVIHYVKADDGCSRLVEGRIDETEFAAFLGAQSPADLSYHVYDAHSCPFSVDEVIARARHCIGLCDYSLWNSNCEHFATWCHTDRPQSKQVDSAVRGGIMAAVAAAGVMLYKLYSNRRQKQARDEAAQQQPQAAAEEQVEQENAHGAAAAVDEPVLAGS